MIANKHPAACAMTDLKHLLRLRYYINKVAAVHGYEAPTCRKDPVPRLHLSQNGAGACLKY